MAIDTHIPTIEIIDHAQARIEVQFYLVIGRLFPLVDCYDLGILVTQPFHSLIFRKRGFTKSKSYKYSVVRL